MVHGYGGRLVFMVEGMTGVPVNTMIRPPGAAMAFTLLLSTTVTRQSTFRKCAGKCSNLWTWSDSDATTSLTTRARG